MYQDTYPALLEICVYLTALVLGCDFSEGKNQVSYFYFLKTWNIIAF